MRVLRQTRETWLRILPSTFAICFAVILAGCDVPESAKFETYIQAPVTPAELEAAVSTGHAQTLIFALGEINRSPLDSEIISEINCAFYVCSDLPPYWSDDILQDPRVRIYMVDALLKADRRGASGIDEDYLLSYLREAVVGDDDEVIWIAMTILSFVGETDDVDIIAAIALQTGDIGTRRAAIIALKTAGNEAYQDALDEVVSVMTAEQLESIEDLL